MKSTRTLGILAMALLAFTGASFVNAQGSVTFDSPWVSNGVGYYVSYDENGMSLRLADWGQPDANMARIGASGPDGHPHNGTPHMELNNALGVPQSAIFTRANTHVFGLLSVALADPVAPSLTPVSITFNGFKGDGSMVSQAFTVGGNGSFSFQTFLFSADFALGLTRVEIPSAAWAMDNLVWIPEPSTASLFFVGLLALAHRRRNAHR